MTIPKNNKSHIDIDSIISELNTFVSKISKIGEVDDVVVEYTIVRKNIFPTNKLFTIKNIIRNIENIVRLKIEINAFSLGFHCDEIIIKSNLRIQGFNKENISVKLYSHKKNTDLSAEIDARKILKEKVPDFKLAPELIDYDRAKAEWIIEEYIELALFQHSKIQKLVQDLLPKLYGNTCCYKQFRSQEFPHLLNTRNSRIKQLVNEIESRNDLIPYAYCHGDMTKSNILKDTQGNVLISDWENSGYRPICTDISKLYLQHKNARTGIIELLDSFTNRHNRNLSSQLQIALGLEAFLNTVIANGNGKLNRKQRSFDRKGRVLIEELLVAAPLAG